MSLNGIGAYSVTASTATRGERVVARIGTAGPAAQIVGTGGSGSIAGSGVYDRPMLDGFINHDSPWMIRQMTRDIFDNDPISGTYCQVMSTMPFSDFELSGLTNKRAINTYADALSSMDIKSAAPEMTMDFLVDGVSVRNLYNGSDTKNDYALMPIDIDQCVLKKVPWNGLDPLVDVKIPSTYQTLLRDRDPRVQEQINRQGAEFRKFLAEKVVPLDPKNTIYFARKTRSAIVEGVPLLRRVIPYYLMEKALIRGTIDLAHRRQKAILQLMIGDDEFVADSTVMAQYIEAFRNADADPLGAIVATPPFVQAQEVGTANGFWSITEYSDYLNTMKMKALGASDALFSGDLTVDTTTSALTIFLDQLRDYRDMYARRILYNKIFLVIAIENDFRRDSRNEVVTGRMLARSQRDRIEATYPNGRFQFQLGRRNPGIRVVSDGTSITMDGETYKMSDYLMPKLQWHKALRPEGNEQVLTALGTLEEKGLPIPLRIYAAAAGVSITEIMRSLDDDINMRKRIIQYRKKLPPDPSQPPAGFGGHDDDDEEVESSYVSHKRVFPEQFMRDPDTGKELSRKGRRFVNDRSNRVASEAIARLNMIENRRDRAQLPINRKYGNSRTVLPPQAAIFGRIS